MKLFSWNLKEPPKDVVEDGKKNDGKDGTGASEMPDASQPSTTSGLMSNAQFWLRLADVTESIDFHVFATTFIMWITRVDYRSTCTEIPSGLVVKWMWFLSWITICAAAIYKRAKEVMEPEETRLRAVRIALLINCLMPIILSGVAVILYHFELLPSFDFIWLMTVYSVNFIALILSKIFRSVYTDIRNKNKVAKAAKTEAKATEKKDDKKEAKTNNDVSPPDTKTAPGSQVGMGSFENGTKAHAILWLAIAYTWFHYYDNGESDCPKYPYADYLYRSFFTYLFVFIYCEYGSASGSLYEQVLKHRHHVFFPFDGPKIKSSICYVLFICFIHQWAWASLIEHKLIPKDDLFSTVCWAFAIAYIARAYFFSKFYNSVKQEELKQKKIKENEEAAQATQQPQQREQVHRRKSVENKAPEDKEKSKESDDEAVIQTRNTVAVVTTTTHNIV